MVSCWAPTAGSRFVVACDWTNFDVPWQVDAPVGSWFQSFISGFTTREIPSGAINFLRPKQSV